MEIVLGLALELELWILALVKMGMQWRQKWNSDMVGLGTRCRTENGAGIRAMGGVGDVQI